MPIEFNTLQRETLTAIVDTFVAAVPTRGRPRRVLRRQGQRRRRRRRHRAVPPHAPARGTARRPAPADRCCRPVRVQGSTPGRPRGDHRQPRRHLARGGWGDRRAAAAFGVVRLLPAGTGWPQPAVGRHGVSGPGPDPAGGRPQDTGGHHPIRGDDARGGCGRGRLRQRRWGGRRSAGAGRQAGDHPGSRQLLQRVRLRAVGTGWHIRSCSCAAGSSPPPTAWSASPRAAPWAAAAPSTGPTRC